jgi:hypothetical protein
VAFGMMSGQQMKSILTTVTSKDDRLLRILVVVPLFLLVLGLLLETKTMYHTASSDDSRQQTELNEDGIANTNDGETSQGGVLLVVPEKQSADQNTNAVDRASQGEALVAVLGDVSA